MQCWFKGSAAWNECCAVHISSIVLSLITAVQGTILPGVTRKSVIQLARQLGYEVQEVNVTVTEAMEADEIFTTGTAVVVSAVGSLTHRVSASCMCLL